MYLGDFNTGQTVYVPWETVALSGGSITRATNGTIHVYKDFSNSTEVTTGVTDTEDFDSLTGIHACAIDLSSDGTFYAAGHDFTVILKAATIDGQTVNAVLAHFSICNRSALRPTTAGRTLDVSAGGEAGIDLANVGNPTTTLNLSGTTVAAVSGAVGSVTGAVGSVTGNVGGNVAGTVASVVGNVGGNVTGSVGSVVGAVGSVAGAVGSVTGNVGGNVTGSVGSVVGAVGSVTGAVGSVTGNVGGNVVGSVASVAGSVGSVTGDVGGNVTGSVGSLATQAKADVNAEVLSVVDNRLPATLHPSGNMRAQALGIVDTELQGDGTLGNEFRPV